MKIVVCMGSACFAKGSRRVFELFRDELEKHGLLAQTELKAAFCLGHCSDAVTTKIDNQFVLGVSEDNFHEIFHQYVLKNGPTA